MTRYGDWIQTYTGKKFYPLDPRTDDVDILDIAHALSLLCRFGGHCLNLYSVAQHSVMVSRQVSPSNQLWALLHDAAEAYIMDIPRPIKRDPSFTPYREAESRVMDVICQRFGLPDECPEEVRVADSRMLLTEHQQLMGPGPAWQTNGLSPYQHLNILEQTPVEAEQSFLVEFERLMGATQ